MQIWRFLWLFLRLFFFSWLTFPSVQNSRPSVVVVCYGMSTPAARALAAGSWAGSGDEHGCRLVAVEAGHLRHWLPLIFQCWYTQRRDVPDRIFGGALSRTVLSRRRARVHGAGRFIRYDCRANQLLMTVLVSLTLALAEWCAIYDEADAHECRNWRLKWDVNNVGWKE
jgi:hypothetical protein